MKIYKLIDLDGSYPSHNYYFFSLTKAENFQRNNPRYIIVERETEDEPEKKPKDKTID